MPTLHKTLDFVKTILYSTYRDIREKFWANRKESKMDIKKLKKLFDQALIIVLLTVATIQILDWFPEYQIVVILGMVLATLRLVR